MYTKGIFDKCLYKVFFNLILNTIKHIKML